MRDAVLNFTHDDVARGHVTYYPLPPAAATGSAAAILEDSFTFVLTARNAQPVSDSVDIDVIPRDYNVIDHASDSTTPSAVAPEVVEEPAVTSQDGGGGGADKVLIVVVIAVLTLLALLGLIVFKCVRSRRAARRRKLELAAAIDGSDAATAAGPGMDRQTSPGRAADPGAPRPGSGAPPRPRAVPPSLPVIIEPSSTDSAAGEQSPVPGVSPGSEVIPNTPESRGGATGYVRVLPPSPSSPASSSSSRSAPPPAATSRVTSHRPAASRDSDDVTPRSPAAAAGRDVIGVTFDWQHVDPELLQHCRKTNPVLHKNQYWV